MLGQSSKPSWSLIFNFKVNSPPDYFTTLARVTSCPSAPWSGVKTAVNYCDICCFSSWCLCSLLLKMSFLHFRISRLRQKSSTGPFPFLFLADQLLPIRPQGRKCPICLWAPLKTSNFVLPAHAGVIPTRYLSSKVGKSFTRTRGGDPNNLVLEFNYFVFYPHTRGWSLVTMRQRQLHQVLPAHAGVILLRLVAPVE